MEELKTDISSVLCASKGLIPAHQLNQDYRTFYGGNIPYAKYGFRNLDEFLKSIPDVVKCVFTNGTTLVTLVPNKDNAHIHELVQGQRKSKGKPKAFVRKPWENNQNYQGFRPNSFPTNPPAFRNNYVSKPNYQPRALPWTSPSFYQPPAASLPRVRSTVVMPPNSTMRSSYATSQPYVPPPPMQNQLQNQSKSAPNAPSSQLPQNNISNQQNPLKQLPMLSVASTPAVPQLNGNSNQQQPLKQPFTASTPAVPQANGSSSQQQPLKQPSQPQNSSQQPTKQPLLSTPASRPTLPIVPAQAAVPVESLTYRQKLAKIAKIRNLGEINYQPVLTKSGKYLGTVTINKQKFSCYPDEYHDVDQAFEEAAKESYNYLEPLVHGDLLPESTDPKVIARRVADLVGNNVKGYWSQSLVEKYAKDFNERLPSNWVQVVGQVTDAVIFDSIGENYLVYPKPKAGEAAVPQSLEMVDPKLYIEQLEPIPASLPESGTMVVHVLVVHGGDRLALRRTDSDDYMKWEDMINNMEMFYTGKESLLPRVEKMEPNILYAAKVDKTWLRVQLNSVRENGLVEVTLVDYADTETIAISDVYPLLTEYGNMPCQGMMCHLHGLTAFAVSDVAIATEIDLLLDQEFIAQVVAKEPQVSLVLYQSSNVNMNERVLIKLAEKEIIVPLKVGIVPQVFVSYVSSTGDVYVVRETQQQNVVESLVSMLAMDMDTPSPRNLPVDPSKIYLGTSIKHGWCRMAPYGKPSLDGNVAVQLLDYGDMEIVPSSSLRDLSTICPVLTTIPGQALRVRLARVPPSSTLVFTEKAAMRLRELAPPEARLVMRVVDIPTSGSPVVELYERLENQKIVIINASLEMDDSLFRSVNGGPINELTRQLSNVALTRTFSTSSESSQSSYVIQQVIVPPPEYPVVDSGRKKPKYDVRVCNVSSPRLFFVQPLASLNKLSALMHELQRACKQPEIINLKLDASSVLEKGYYAGWHAKTAMYHRVQVVCKMGPDFLVNLIDYGDNVILSLNLILPLPPNLGSLPAQAMQAQLSGVKPVSGDWGMDDVLFFKKLVDEKNFSCYVMDVMPDKILQLEMIDVSKKQDVIISKYLIDCHRALPV